jgi:hypothetical protein
MIFGGPTAAEGWRQQKLLDRQVNAVDPAVPRYLRWSESSITFDRSDHPAVIHEPGRFPLIVEAIFERTRLTKVFMDGGSGLNLLYARTLDAMKIPRTALKPSSHPFHGVILGVQAIPMGRIDLAVTFGTPDNFRKEKLTFEVVDFPSDTHAILGRPCYVKFMAIPSYSYLKLKMPGPKGTITVASSLGRALENERANRELAELVVAKTELEQLAKDAEGSTPTLDSKRPRAVGAFEPAEDSKPVQLDPTDSSKVARIGTNLDPK